MYRFYKNIDMFRETFLSLFFTHWSLQPQYKEDVSDESNY